MPAALLTLPNVLAAAMLVALNAYVLFGGADFGGGVWDLFARGPRREAQRALVAEAIGPIWEANHVWLIIVVVVMFTCFPPAFAALATALHVPLSLMLVGVVLRGSAFAFRSTFSGGGGDAAARRSERRWGRLFAVASVITPLLLGMSIGAIASGRLTTDVRRGFSEVFLRPWLTPFALVLGCFALALMAFLAAVYLTVEARDPALRDDFRRRALGSALAVALLGAVLPLLARRSAPLMHAGLLGSSWGPVLAGATAVAALVAAGALWTRRWVLARAAAAAQVSLILWGWALAQYPYLIPPRLSIADAAASPNTLRPVLVALAVGAVVLVPSLVYLFRVFKRRPTVTAG